MLFSGGIRPSAPLRDRQESIRIDAMLETRQKGGAGCRRRLAGVMSGVKVVRTDAPP